MSSHKSNKRSASSSGSKSSIKRVKTAEIEDEPEPTTEDLQITTSKDTTTKQNYNEDTDEDLDDIYDPYLVKKELKFAKNTKVPEITIILELASLEIVKTKKGDFQLLNCDDHVGLIRKFKKDPSEYRPDIIHQVNKFVCFNCFCVYRACY
jgi:hypothetical protein